MGISAVAGQVTMPGLQIEPIAAIRTVPNLTKRVGCKSHKSETFNSLLI